MAPRISAGDYILVRRCLNRIREDAIVVVRHSDFGILVKRVQRITEDGYILTGENPQSISPEKMGIVRKTQVLGKVVCCFRQSGRGSTLRP